MANKLVISTYACKKNDLSMDEAFMLLSLVNDINFKRAAILLQAKGLIMQKVDDPSEYAITARGIAVIDQVIADSLPCDHHAPLEELAAQLKELFPKGKKAGTNYYWTEGKDLIVKRLLLFFKKYNRNYTNEQILDATKRYVESFNGDYRYMRLLKYFILKEEKGAAGDTESTCDLITWIENKGDEDSISQSWTSHIM